MDIIKLIADLIIPIITLVLTAVVIPHAKEWLQTRYAKQLVTAAEQLFGPGTGFIKREYVAEKLKSRWKLTDQQVEILIESAVGEFGHVWDVIKEVQEEDSVL